MTQSLTLSRYEPADDVEYLFDVAGKSSAAIVEQLLEAEPHIPGLIFSYPPIGSWTADEAAATRPLDLWSTGERRFAQNIYIHIPFCRQRCSFCYYSVTVKKDDTDLIWEYVKTLAVEARMYAPRFRNIKINTVFIGGGTPSRLSPDQVKYLFDEVLGQFDLSECKEISYECSPDSASPDRIAAMAECGVTRLSMGVQTLDPEVLHRSRRSDDPEDVLATYYNMIDSGIQNVNIDLIAGIEQEAFSDIRRTMDAIALLDPKPPQITMFTLSVREKAIDRWTFREQSIARQFSRSLALYRYAKRRMLGELGYWQYSRNLFPQTDEIFHYQDSHWGHNGYVLPLGVSGYGHSPDYVYLNNFSLPQYMRAVNSGASHVERALRLTPEESKRRHLVLAMKHRVLDLPTFASYYPGEANPLGFAEEPLRALEDLGVIHRDADTIAYTDTGIDLADKYCRLFYSEAANGYIKDGLNAAKDRSIVNAFDFTF
jgi:oxygen-independent coproporphyrinogen-3 oxidase